MIHINLLPIRDWEAKETRRQEISMAGLCLILTGVGLLAIYLWQSSNLSDEETKLAALQQQIKTLDTTLKDVSGLKVDIKTLKEKLNVIEELSKKKTGPVRVMESLSSATPKKLWLTEFKESGGSLSLNGMALDNETIAGFLKSLSASPHFDNVELIETTQVDQKTGQPMKKFVMRSSLLYRLPSGGKEEKKGKNKK